jgi:CDP-diacylglycerol pyrophosphatase
MIGPANGLNFSQTAVVLSLLLATAPGVSYGAEKREALWQVVQACRVNHDMTGAAFPCLDVNVSGGIERGYVILRPPFGDEDLILSPTRKIVGVEDPSLRAADAPNYFADAWNARSLLITDKGRPLARENVAVAVNSGLLRTQDQLHLHIGCLTPQVKSSFQAIEPDLSPVGWRRLTRPIGGLIFWALRIDQETLEGVNPFRLALDGLPIEPKNLGHVTMIVAGSQSIEGRGGFILLATINDPLRDGFRSSASVLLANFCPV